MSVAIISERSHSPTYKISHLLTLEGVKSRTAQKQSFISAKFSSSDDKAQTKFSLIVDFGKEKDGQLSIYLKPDKEKVFIKECTFTLLDVNFNKQKSTTYRNQLFSTVGMGYPDFYDLTNFSLPDDTLCLRTEFIYVGESPSDGTKEFSSRDANFDDDLRRLSANDKNADVTLHVGGKKFRAHKALLEERSGYFRALFDSGMKESKENEVPIADADPKIFKHYLDFLYTGLPPTSLFQEAWDLLPLADRFGATTLKDKCEGAIISHVSSTNAIKALTLAHAHSCPSLVEKSLPLIRANMKVLKTTVEWKEMKKNADLLALVIESFAE